MNSVVLTDWPMKVLSISVKCAQFRSNENLRIQHQFFPSEGE